MKTTRREFLAHVALGAGAGIFGCSDSSVSPVPFTPATSGLDHIVVVMMENRSFDHLLGWLPTADGKQAGLSYPDRAGVSRQTRHLQDFQGCGLVDPTHSFDGGRAEYNNGACDGFLRAASNDEYAIGYYNAADLPFLGVAAPQWTVLDRYFAAFLGPTFPNRLILQAGQTDRLDNALVPCTLPTIWDRLAAAGVTGRNYGSATGVSAGLFGTRYSSIIKPVSSFYTDAAAGALPGVALVDPDFFTPVGDSYHPPGDIRDAEAFLANVYRAVTTGPAWGSTLLIITFDEWGGFFDHVPPPGAPIPPGELAAGNTDGLRGFRVPTLLVSPFARRRVTSSKVYDHASILRLIEW
ncbi:MAG: alkaline phosphatase family protein, partial [Gemmatimonadales bacterium]